MTLKLTSLCLNLIVIFLPNLIHSPALQLFDICHNMTRLKSHSFSESIFTKFTIFSEYALNKPGNCMNQFQAHFMNAYKNLTLFISNFSDCLYLLPIGVPLVGHYRNYIEEYYIFPMVTILFVFCQLETFTSSHSQKQPLYSTSNSSTDRASW